MSAASHSEESPNTIPALCVLPVDPKLRNALTAWRRRTSFEVDCPAWWLFTDATRDAIARRRPTSIATLRSMGMLDEWVLDRHGKEIAAVVASVGCESLPLPVGVPVRIDDYEIRCGGCGSDDLVRMAGSTIEVRLLRCRGCEQRNWLDACRCPRCGAGAVGSRPVHTFATGSHECDECGNLTGRRVGAP